MEGVLNGSLSEWRNVVHKGNHDKNITVLVLSVHRFLVDPGFRSQTGLDPGCHSEGYDLVVTDTQTKAKYLLNPSKNYLVQSGELQAGSIVQLTADCCEVHYNEEEITSEDFLIINNIEVLGEYTHDLDIDDIGFCEASGHKEGEDVPLVTTRGSYLPLWNNVDPCGASWDTSVMSHKAVDTGPITDIASLAAQWKTLRKPYPPLLVRVLSRSRLRYYGKASKHDKWPYQLYLEIADQSGSCTAILWTSACPEFFNSLHVGAVIWIHKYTARGRFQLMSRYCDRHADLPRFDIEVTLNRHHPVTEVKVIDPAEVKDTWELPEVKFKFLTRKQLSCVPNKYNCDIAGVVTHVGRCQRLRKGLGGSEDFWQYQWLHLRDDSSPLPIRVQLFATSQVEPLYNILPGSLLVCTQMLVLNNIDDITNSRQSRTIYLTTTNESQVYNNKRQLLSFMQHDDTLRQLYSQHPVIEEGYSLGGYYWYPPLPTTLPAYQDSFPPDNPLKVTISSELQRLCNTLCKCEHKQVTVQGFLVRIKYMPLQTRGDLLNMAVAEDDIPVLSPLHTRRAGKSTRKAPVTSASKRKKLLQEKVIDNDLWPGVMERVTTVGMATAHPSFCAQRCKARDKALKGLVVRELMLPSGEYSGKHESQHTLQDLNPVSAVGCFQLIVVSLNHSLVINTLLPIPAKVHDPSVTVVDLLCGSASGGATVPVTAEIVAHVVESSLTLREQRLVLVLDLYSHCQQEVEIVLNRGYCT